MECPVTRAPVKNLHLASRQHALGVHLRVLTLLTLGYLCSLQRLMSVNYLGSVYPSRAVITTMKERRVGRIVFVSSQAGQLGLFGFTAYSSSKFAIRGLAEALQMEVNAVFTFILTAFSTGMYVPHWFVASLPVTVKLDGWIVKRIGSSPNFAVNSFSLHQDYGSDRNQMIVRFLLV